MVSHEDYVTEFHVKKDFMRRLESHPDFHQDRYELGGKTVHEVAIPHDMIGEFNANTVRRRRS
ncbi:hypothetical protein [Streptomyces sp. NPDC057253]|uniref:hypothetical protein n=1 Tax=Streptomyces sp. NPDC057253 TaxID=3346069 RepID=UPI00362579ED